MLYNNFYDITGKLVHAQYGFPSGTIVNCYGTDFACSGTPTDILLNYSLVDGTFSPSVLSQNPCCFFSNPFAFIPFNYYTALGSRCQSCSGKQFLMKHIILWLVTYIALQKL